MLRKTFLVEKEKIFDILNRKDVIKIELAKSKNKGLRNPKVCKIYVYFTIDFQVFANFIGHCGVAHKTFKDIPGNVVLSGLGTCKKVGFIRESIVLKIKEYREKNNIKVYIPKDLLKFQNLQL